MYHQQWTARLHRLVRIESSTQNEYSKFDPLKKHFTTTWTELLLHHHGCSKYHCHRILSSVIANRLCQIFSLRSSNLSHWYREQQNLLIRQLRITYACRKDYSQAGLVIRGVYPLWGSDAFPSVSDFPPISEKNFRRQGKFFPFHHFPKTFSISSSKISDDLFLVVDYKFCISPYFRRIVPFSPISG